MLRGERYYIESITRLNSRHSCLRGKEESTAAIELCRLRLEAGFAEGNSTPRTPLLESGLFDTWKQLVYVSKHGNRNRRMLDTIPTDVSSAKALNDLVMHHS